MNIGIDIRSLMSAKRSGVGEYTYELLNAVFKIDRENQYFLFYNSYTDVSKNIPKWEQGNVHYVASRWPNKLFSAFVLLRIVRLNQWVERKNRRIGKIKRLKDYHNITISQYHNINVWFSPNLNFTALSSRIKSILTIHDLSFEFLPDCFTAKQRWWHRVLQPKKQCERADLILAPSENTRRDVVEKYEIAGEKVKVLYPGLCSRIPRPVSRDPYPEDKINDLRKKYDLPDRFILYLGTIEPRKNIEGIIEAYNGLRVTGIGLRESGYGLIVAGAKGWKCQPILDKINQTDGVQYIGYVDEEDKASLYQMADLFVYPSLYEGFGFPVLEAMACKVPVITSNRSSLPEVVGNAACLVNPHNVSEIARGMKLLLQDNELRDKLVERGRERVEKFKWKKTAEEFVDFLER